MAIWQFTFHLLPRGGVTMMRHKIAIVNDEASLMMLLRYNLETKYSLHLYDNTMAAPKCLHPGPRARPLTR